MNIKSEILGVPSIGCRQYAGSACVYVLDRSGLRAYAARRCAYFGYCLAGATAFSYVYAFFYKNQQAAE